MSVPAVCSHRLAVLRILSPPPPGLQAPKNRAECSPTLQVYRPGSEGTVSAQCPPPTILRGLWAGLGPGGPETGSGSNILHGLANTARTRTASQLAQGEGGSGWGADANTLQLSPARLSGKAQLMEPSLAVLQKAPYPGGQKTRQENRSTLLRRSWPLNSNPTAKPSVGSLSSALGNALDSSH
jgi:hypothetical protein